MGSSIIFRNLWIFSPVEGLGKHVSFGDGVNIITSSDVDGTDRGKSVLAMSLYHCMGADCKFSQKWGSNKVYILQLAFSGKSFFIYRNRDLFRLFDAEMNQIGTTSSRHELGKLYSELFGIEMQLPNRYTQEMEITPPAFSFAPYYLDQNNYQGSTFQSFNNMGQYEKYKERLIYNFTGVFDADYYAALKDTEESGAELAHCESKIAVVDGMLGRVAEEIDGHDYALNEVQLQADCEEHEEAYKRLADKLSKTRSKLLSLREERAELELAIEGIRAFEKRMRNTLKTLDSGVCPLCSNELISTAEARITGCSTIEDALLMGDSLRLESNKIEEKISQEEQLYSSMLRELNCLKRKIGSIRNANKTSLQIEGLNQLASSLSAELARERLAYRIIKEKHESLKKQLNKYGKAKSKVNERFVELIVAGVSTLNLQEINPDRVKDVSSKIDAQGSNMPIATLLWYFTLITLKEEFNPERISLPLVLDSPANVETDQEKKDLLYGMIFNDYRYSGQSIVTGLGLKNATVTPKNATIIELNNEKYKLLNSNDYEKWKGILYSCMEQ